jgi:hypothetical protein
MGGIFIKKLGSNHKQWLEEHCLKLMKKKSRKKKIRKVRGMREFIANSHVYSSRYGRAKNKGKKIYSFKAPEIFNVEKNPEETINFFNSIIEKRRERKFNSTFFIDVSNVKEVSCDAVMYIIALLHDTKHYSYLRYKFSGNFPVDIEARKYFIESGFLSYVQSVEKNIKPQSKKIQIIQGQKSESPIAKKICIFIQKICCLSRVDTIPLYNVLVELMGNTSQHAYVDKSQHDSRANSWYLYAEETNVSIKFVFLDTGVGIPSTVNKKWSEKIPFMNKDSEFIKSALNGEFRTQTRENHRGKGLPQIVECCQSGLLKNVLVLSGKGLCRIQNDSNSSYITKDMSDRIFGTLFSWEIEK